MVIFNFREALLSVAQTFFETVDLGSESIKVCNTCVRNVYLVIRSATNVAG